MCAISRGQCAKACTRRMAQGDRDANLTDKLLFDVSNAKCRDACFNKLINSPDGQRVQPNISVQEHL